MKSGICPKCSSSNIYADGDPKRGDRCTIPISSWKKLFLDTYVCLDCGFVEEYVCKEDLKNSKKIEKLKEEWNKV